ncbi:MAG: NAD-binding protein [Leptolyngbyaceae cyanobacterium bins.59]|nr:NAD-binding protein [Leptolyngbyaceae cyanobacterium bins.59]
MRKITLTDRLRYQFDNFMARGPVALIGGLALVSLVFILIMGILVSLTGIAPEGSERLNSLEAIWSVLMRTLDAGTMGGDTGWVFRLAMLLVTFGGIFIISTLIGLLSNGINDKLESLRKGRSRVIETDHLVILGWSLQIFTLISELTLANANRPDTCIVVLSEMDKVEMEDALQDALGKVRRLRLVCRTGSPSNMADLGIVSVQMARSIIILNQSSEQSDVQVVKTLLAVTNIPRSASTPYHIVAQVQDPKNSDILKLVGRDEIEIVLTNEMISRIVVQTCRQSGLSAVYMELLSFSGNEIYLKSEPNLRGKTYGEALSAYNDSIVMGIKPDAGPVQLNPPMDTVIESGTQLVYISEDDDKIYLSGIAAPLVDRDSIRIKEQSPLGPEKTLILGWNDRLTYIIQQLDAYVAPGSLVTVIADWPIAELGLTTDSLNIQNQKVEYRQGDPTQREVLEALDLTQYDHVLVLCNTGLEPEQADAQTLITLLYLRELADRSQHDFQIVTEILDVRNQALAQVARPDDFVISEQIVSRMLSQVAEQKNLNAVFEDLFNPEGSEIYLKPVANYITGDRPVNFYTIVEAAKQQGESAIGYRRQADADNMAKAYGIVLNPKKDQTIKFAANDLVILLAEK